MKVKLLPLAIGAAIAMPGVAMADGHGPKVYGKMNVTYEMADFDTGVPATEGDTWELNSNASRLGVKGSEEITDDLSAIYQAEFGINVDEGSDPFSQRDIFVGLKGGWGTFKAGRFDTPLKKSQGKIDQFNDMSAGDIGSVVVGEERESNLLQYSSPVIADAVTINVAVQPGEDVCGDGAPDDCQDGVADNFSASVVYNTDMLYLALAMDDGIGSDILTYDARTDTIRLTGILNVDVFSVGLLYQTSEESEPAAGDPADEQEGYILSASMKLGSDNKIRFQYGASENDDVVVGSTTTIDITQIGLGFDHKLSKQTKLFANYIMLEEEVDGASSSDEETRLQFGLEHKF